MRATEEVVLVEIAQYEIGIRHRGFCAALAIGDGPRNGSGATRADLQCAAGPDMADRAATGAERDDVEAFQRDALPSHGAATAKCGLAIQNQRDISGGAADIEGDEVLPHAALRQRYTGRDAARWTR